MKSEPRLPPLQTLRAFAAAGRHQSLRDAAAELGLTPSAISHQVKALERWIGAPLFERGVRQVRLNPAGAALSEALNRSFSAIEGALLKARKSTVRKSLVVATLPLFASAWLGPRLPQFEAMLPDVSLTVHTDARIYDLAAGEADVAIRNVEAPGPGLRARKLLDLRATPLCRPDIAAGLKTPADLTSSTLIHLSVGRAGWPEWLALAGFAGLKPKRSLTVDTVPEAIAAALRGRGVMLGLLPLIWAAEGTDRLCAPFALKPQNAGAYFIACRQADHAVLPIRLFMDWVTGEMRADVRCLMKRERDGLKRR